MKRTLLAALLAASLTACAGLNVSGSVTMSYNTDAKVNTQAIHLTSPVDALGEQRKK